MQPRPSKLGITNPINKRVGDGHAMRMARLEEPGTGTITIDNQDATAIKQIHFIQSLIDQVFGTMQIINHV